MKLKGKIMAMAAALAVLLMTIPFVVGTVTALDTGAYEIKDGSDLVNYINALQTDSSASAFLANDIIMSDINKVKHQTVIDNTDTITINGYFDGCGHKISGLKAPFVELVGENALVENLVLEGAITYADDGSCGAVANTNNGTIKNCYNKVNVKNEQAGSTVGGIAGENNGTIEGCVNAGDITGAGNTGGICGTNNSSVTKCCNFGSISSSNYSGGICGSGNGSVSYSYNAGTLTGSTNGVITGENVHCQNCAYCVQFYVEGNDTNGADSFSITDATSSAATGVIGDLITSYGFKAYNLVDAKGATVAYAFPQPSYFDGKVAPISLRNTGTAENPVWDNDFTVIGNAADLVAFSKDVNDGNNERDAVVAGNIEDYVESFLRNCPDALVIAQRICGNVIFFAHFLDCHKPVSLSLFCVYTVIYII